MNKTSIPWCDFTWNPTTGCTRGCDYCYARKVAERFGEKRTAQHSLYAGMAVEGDEWHNPFPFGFYPTTHSDRLDEPLRRKKPSIIFLGSMGDLFDPAFPDSFRDRVFATVAAAHWHTFMVLTKRADAMQRYFRSHRLSPVVLPNLVLGVSVTNQEDADERIPYLLCTPAAKRMVSVEPMLGRVNLTNGGMTHADWYPWDFLQGKLQQETANLGVAYVEDTQHLDFVAVGGKTPGPPLHEQDDCPIRGVGSGCSCTELAALRSLRDQCIGACVPFHYKHGGTNPALDGVVYDWRPE